MKILEVVDKEKFELRTVDKPHLAKDEVLIKVSYCGICGSDLPRYFQGAVHRFPQVLGHEFSGTVVEVGKSVLDLELGTFVTVAPLVPCFKCDACLSGNPAMCTEYSFIGSRQQGAMATYISVPRKNVVLLPQSIDLKTAALIEPLTVAIHGVEMIDFNYYEDFLILGSGTIGLMTLIALKNRGKGTITVVDINDDKLKLAKELGADVVLNSMDIDLETYYEENERASVILETAGSSITQVQAISLSKKKTQVVYMGTCTKDIVFKPHIFEKILRNELTIKGSWMSYSAPFPGYEWHAAIQIVNEQKDLLNKIITHTYTLEQAEQAFNKVIDRNDAVAKVMLKIEEDSND